MATTLLERYRETCELQESRRLRNEQMNRDAVRLRSVFIPVNTEKLQTLKSQWLKALSTSDPQTGHYSAPTVPFSHGPPLPTPTQSRLLVTQWQSTDEKPSVYTTSSQHSAISFNPSLKKPFAVPPLAGSTGTLPTLIPLVSSLGEHKEKPTVSDHGGSQSNTFSVDSESPLDGSMEVFQVDKPRSDAASLFVAETNGVGCSNPGPVLTSTLVDHQSKPSPPQTHVPLASESPREPQHSRPISCAQIVSAPSPTAVHPNAHVFNGKSSNNGAIKLDANEMDGEDMNQQSDEDQEAGSSNHKHSEESCEDEDLSVEVPGDKPMENEKINGWTQSKTDEDDPDNERKKVSEEMELQETGKADEDYSQKQKETTSDHPVEKKPLNGEERENTSDHEELEDDASAKKDDSETESDNFWDEEVKPTAMGEMINVEQSPETDGRSDDGDRGAATSSTSSIEPQNKNYSNVLTALTTAINSNIRKDRDLAQQLYNHPSLTDGMKDQIQDSPVLNSLLTKRAGFGKDISSWDTSALTSVMLKLLSDARTTHGPPVVEDFTNADSLWHSLWPSLLEHIRLLFQCGKPLEDTSEVFSAALGIDKAKLLELLQHECGIEPTATQDITVSSLTSSILSSHNTDDTKSVGNIVGGGGMDAYKSLLQSSHNSELQLSSLSECSEIAALQNIKPMGTSLELKQDANDESDDDFDDSLSLPLSDLSPQQTAKSKPLLDGRAIKRRMGYFDDLDVDNEEHSHISVPSNKDDDGDFEFYQ